MVKQIRFRLYPCPMDFLLLPFPHNSVLMDSTKSSGEVKKFNFFWSYLDIPLDNETNKLWHVPKYKL